MTKFVTMWIVLLALAACNSETKKQIDEDKLGLIDADVRDVETNLKSKAEYTTNMPGSGVRFERSFENAPPLIPHTTDGFFPITIKNNICLSCHMPDKIKESKAISIPETHFTLLRPKLQMKDGKYQMADTLMVKSIKELNKAYYNCSQCHVPQATVSVNIENLFTPEFRAKNGLNQSNLNKKIKEGVKK